MMMSNDFMTFLRFTVGLVLLAVVVALGTVATFGLIDLYDTVVPHHGLVCVQAHDEFHQTDNGTKVQVCTSYQRH